MATKPSRGSRALYRLFRAHRPPTLESRLIEGPVVAHFSDGMWLYEDDVKLVRRLFFSLLRDHCGQIFADFAFAMLNESTTAYATAYPGRVKNSYDFASRREHPSAVRLEDDLTGRPLAEVMAEIEANAATVMRACATKWYPHLDAILQQSQQEVAP